MAMHVVTFSEFVMMSFASRYLLHRLPIDVEADFVDNSSAIVDEEAGNAPDPSHQEVGSYDADQRGAKARRNMKKRWAAESQNMKDKWEVGQQLHDVHQKLASDLMKAHLRVLGKREGDPVIGDEDAGSTILRVARKSDDVKRSEGVAAIEKAYAYVLNEQWQPDYAMRVEDEISYLRDDEVAVLWIQGGEPWSKENLRMTLQLVHMFEEYGGWITISTETRWANRRKKDVWLPSERLSLKTVMQQHYPELLTDDAIEEATATSDQDHHASFGSWTLQSMPAYYPTGYARKNGDTATFLPSDD